MACKKKQNRSTYDTKKWTLIMQKKKGTTGDTEAGTQQKKKILIQKNTIINNITSYTLHKATV